MPHAEPANETPQTTRNKVGPYQRRKRAWKGGQDSYDFRHMQTSCHKMLPAPPTIPFCLSTHFCWQHFALKFHARKSIKNFRSSGSAASRWHSVCPSSTPTLSLSPSLFFAFSHPPTCLFLFAAALQLILSHAFDQIQLKVKRTTRVRGNYSVSHSHSHSYVFFFALTLKLRQLELCYQPWAATKSQFCLSFLYSSSLCFPFPKLNRWKGELTALEMSRERHRVTRG